MGKIIIDGLEFDGRYSDVSDIENLNYFLEEKFNKFEIKNYMSRLHPELFPGFIGLHCNKDMSLSIVKFVRHTLNDWGEYDNGWSCCSLKEPEKYRDDILAFYKDNDICFYNFIKDKIK